MKSRKVNSRWITNEVAAFLAHGQQGTEQVWVDVAKRGMGDYVVSVRHDFALNMDRGYITDYPTRRAARAYAMDYAEYLAGNRDCPRQSDYKYIDLM